MGLAPSSDWFNLFTAALVNIIEGMNKLMDNFLAMSRSIQVLEDTLEKFLQKCNEIGVKIGIKKLKMGRRMNFGGFIVSNIAG